MPSRWQIPRPVGRHLRPQHRGLSSSSSPPCKPSPTSTKPLPPIPLRRHSHHPHPRRPFPYPHTRTFTSSAPRGSNHAAASDVTYYDLLKLPSSASPGEIKRRYYELSKTHHPDRNPNDPEASTRFARISEAYATIGNPQKREKYDKELVRRHGVRHPRGAGGETYGPAGGRPASGLSRRRTQFHGPPPSFFRSGGWASGSAAGRARDPASAAASGSTNFYAGGSPQTRAQGGRNDDVPHFDFEKHRSQQDRVRRKPTKAEFPFIPEGIMMPLLAVGSLLLIVVGISSRDSKGMDKARHSEQRK